jgi:hypothetical protein
MPYLKMYSSDGAYDSSSPIKYAKKGHSAVCTASDGEEPRSSSPPATPMPIRSTPVSAPSQFSRALRLRNSSQTHSTPISSHKTLQTQQFLPTPQSTRQTRSQSRPILPTPDSAGRAKTKSRPSLLTPISIRTTRSKSRTTLTPVANHSQVHLPQVKQLKTKRQVEREAEEREAKRVRIEKENKAQERMEVKEVKEQRREEREQIREEKERTKELELLRKANVQAEVEKQKETKERERLEKENAKLAKELAKEREAAEQLQWENVKAKEVFNALTKPSTPEERVFSSTLAFFKALLSGATVADGVDTMQATANISRFFRDHGVEAVNLILDHTPSIEAKVLASRWKEKLDRLSDEGEKVQKLLTRDSKTSLSQLLEGFSIDGLTSQLREEAPMVWECLSAIVPKEKRGTDHVRLLYQDCSFEVSNYKVGIHDNLCYA